MPKLHYAAIASLDGYVADRGGDFSWAAPDEEVHAFVNELERPVGIHLYGRRMYEVMRVWESDEILEDQPPVMHDYAEIWRAAEKVVYSKRLEAVETERTRLEREFDPAAVERLKREATTDISIGGATLAACALAAGLVDEVQLLLSPVVVGGGRPALPVTEQVRLELLEQRRFDGGTVFLRYGLLA
jgi:dihydrofolate reductase